jgi:hypothetical protein
MPAPRTHRLTLLPLTATLTALLLTAGAAAADTTSRPSPAPAPAPQHGVRLRYLGEQELPNAMPYDGTTVGGLSAISYDARTGQYYVISDDRSQRNPARFYTAEIGVSPTGLDSVRITGTHPFLQPDGSTYPPTVTTPGQPQTVAPDPEGIAVDPATGRLLWSSEGERIVSTTAAPVLEDPWVHAATTTGTYLGQYALPPQEHMNAQAVGPRQNQTLEGLSFTPDGTQLYASMEDPLLQDGADPTPAAGALTRVTRYDPHSGLPTAQYGYPLSPFFTRLPAGDTTDTNGVSDLLALGDGRFLVVERASVYAQENWKIRIYLASDAGATDVLARDALTEGAVRPMTKQLLADLSDVPGLPRVDNVEGITLGPRLADGRRTLVLVSDDNFSTLQVTQFIAFAVSGL